MIGYYDGTAVQVKEPLQMNQKVIVIPIENDTDLGESAAGGLHKYANQKTCRGIIVYLMQMQC